MLLLSFDPRKHVAFFRGAKGDNGPEDVSTEPLSYNSSMKITLATRRRSLPVRRGGLVTRAAIRRLAAEIAEKFQPEKIILFGSYAYGQPHLDSDVDLLVVMPARNEIDQACKICVTVDHPFPMDLLVRKPKTMEWRLREGDWFLREVVSKGIVLYEQNNQAMGR